MQDNPSDMGELLFEGQNQHLRYSIIWMIVLGFSLYFLVFEHSTSFEMKLGVGVLAVYTGIRCIRDLPTRFQLFERGIQINSLLGLRVLKMTDLNGFSYDASISEGKSPGGGGREVLDVRMRFQSKDGRRAEFRTGDTFHSTGGRRSSPHDKLQLVREKMIERIAITLASEIEENGNASWTPTLKLTRDGIAYRKFEMGGWNDFKLDGFGFDADYKTDEDGVCHFLDKTLGRTLHQENMSAMNFYPGLHVLVQRYSRGDHTLVASIRPRKSSPAESFVRTTFPLGRVI